MSETRSGYIAGAAEINCHGVCGVAAMKGTFPKRVPSCHLACARCIYFCNSDPDIFYCDLHHVEFPGLCYHYSQVKKEESVELLSND